MFKLFKTIKKENLLTSLIYIIIGSVLFFNPQLSITFIIYGVSIILLIYGIIHMINYFKENNGTFYEKFDLVIGAISLGTGIFILVDQILVISIIPFIIGVFLIIKAINLIKQANLLKHYNSKQHKISIILAIIIVISGLYLIFNPIKIVKTLITVIGFLLICMGTFELWTYYNINKFLP